MRLPKYSVSFLTLVVVSSVVGLSPRPAGAASFVWLNTGGGNWSSTANWGSTVLPGPSDSVDIPASAGIVDVDTGASAGQLSIDGPGTIVNVLPGDALSISNGLTNNGTITLSGGGGVPGDPFATLGFGAGTLAGSGNIVLNYNGGTAGVVGVTNSLTETGPQTISGAGQLFFYTASGVTGMFTNLGVVDADVPGQALSINAGGGYMLVSNKGALEASNGGLLTVDASVNNAGGTISASSGGTVQISTYYAVVTGGTLATAGGSSAVQLLSSSLSDVTIAPGSLVTIPGPGTPGYPAVYNGLVNNGTIEVGMTSTAGPATINFSGTQTLSGSGSIILGPSASGTYNSELVLTGGPLTQTPGHMISGAGLITPAAGQLIAAWLNNEGTVDANVPGQTLQSNSTIANGGTLEATNGGILSLAYYVFNSGCEILASGGTVQFNMGNGVLTGGTVASSTSSAVSFQSGTLSGVTLSGPSSVPSGDGITVSNGLVNNGIIAVGSSSSPGPSTITFSGTQTLSGSGSIILGPSASGAYNSELVLTGGPLTQTPGHMISGAGLITPAAGQLIAAWLNNEGTVDANVPGQTLQSNSTIANGGTLEATNGGILSLAYYVFNSGCEILASGGTVQFNMGNGVLTGGTVASSTSSAVSFQSGTLSGVTLSGPSSVPSGDGITVSNGLVNNGIIAVGSSSSPGPSTITFSGTQTLSGSGSIILGPSASGAYNSELVLTGGPLTQTPGHMISGAGLIANGNTNGNPASLINGGVIDANIAGQALTLPSNLSCTNSGVLEATNGGTLQVECQLTGGTLASSGESTVSLLGAILYGGETFSAGCSAVVPAGAGATLSGGLTNQGTITVADGSGGHGELYFEGTATLSGSGTIVLASAPATIGIYNSLTQAAGHTISGAGLIANGNTNGNPASLTNGGVIDANIAGQALTLPSNLSCTNSGVLEATNGGTLQVECQLTGGTLASSGESTVSLLGAILYGGETFSAGCSAVVPAGAGATLSGGLTNQGTITVADGSGGHGELYFEGTATLSGSGTIVLASAPATIGIYNSLTQAAGHTISGAGLIANGNTNGNPASLTNGGVIDVNIAGQALTLPSNLSCTNSGVLEATNGGTLTLGGNINNAGGMILAYGGTVQITGSVAQLSGGTLTGGTWIAQGGSPLIITSGGGITTNGATVVLDGAGSSFPNIKALANNQGSFSLLDGQSFSTTGSLTNSGTIGVDATSRLTVAGNLSTTSGAALDLGITGGTNSLLAVTGSLTVAGQTTLNVSAAGPLGASYTLASYAHTSAEASNFSLVGAPSGYGLEVGASDLVLGAGSWAAASSGSWNGGANWSFGSPPSGAGITAVVGAATTTSCTITLDSPQTVGTLIFANSASNSAGYFLAAGTSGSLTMDNAGSGAAIIVTGGSHAIAANMTFDDSLTVTPSAGATLTILGNIGDNGADEPLLLNGNGTLILSGTNSYGGGTVVSAGTLIVGGDEGLADGSNLIIGDALFFAGISSGSASNATAASDVPAVGAVPEPGALALLAACAAIIFVCRRCRRFIAML